MGEKVDKKRLRELANKRLGDDSPLRTISDVDAPALAEELGIHKEELLIQNEELKRIQLELEDSRTKYFELYDLAPVGYITLTKDLIIKESNLAASALLGVERDLLVNRGLSSFVTPRSLELLLLHYRRLNQGQEKQIHQILFQKKDKREVLVQFESNLVVDNFEVRYRSILTDVTELTKMEKFADALNMINSRISSSFDFEEIMVQVVVSASKAMNHAATSITMKEQGDWIIRYESNLPQRLNNFPIEGKLLEMSNLTSETMKVVCTSDAQNNPITSNPSGKGYGLKSAMTAPLIVGGEVIGVLGFSYFDRTMEFTQSEIDFTRKLASSISMALANARLVESLRERETKYRELFENLYEGVSLYHIVSDVRGEIIDLEIIDINPAGLRGFGDYSVEELIGRKISELFSPKLRVETMERTREMKVTGMAISKTVRSDDNERYYLTTYLPTSKDTLTITRIDVTDQKLLEEELKRSNIDLQQFAYVASHDLKEPLRMVASYLYLLEKLNGGKWDDVSKEYMQFASNGASRMQAMIDDLLTYARVATNVKPDSIVDMNEVLALVKVDMELGLRESNGSLVNERLPFILADKSQMMLLMENLVGNALKYRGKEAPEINIGFQDNSKEWLFWVHDNGIGIDPKYHERIFQIFQRLHTQEFSKISNIYILE
jgi:PAS domain S-box-containing protein